MPGGFSRQTASALRTSGSRAFRTRARLIALAALVWLAGCSGPNSQTSSIFGGLMSPPETPEPAPMTAHARPEKTAEAPPDKGGCASPAECRVTLKLMIENPDRGWIGQQQMPHAYADGTRLFAYRALRRQMTCNELSLAVDELRGASKSLGGPVSGMSSDQVSRTRALCSQVEAELARERTGRCRT